MESQKSIEDPLKGSKNSPQISSQFNQLKGLKLERKISEKEHRIGIPILVQPHLLRSRGAGQIDIARIRKTDQALLLEVIEVKNSMRITTAQQRRLFDSCHYLGQIFDLPCRLLFRIS